MEGLAYSPGLGPRPFLVSLVTGVHGPATQVRPTRTRLSPCTGPSARVLGGPAPPRRKPASSEAVESSGSPGWERGESRPLIGCGGGRGLVGVANGRDNLGGYSYSPVVFSAMPGR